MNIKAFFGVLL